MRGTTLILQSLPLKHSQITVCSRKKLIQNKWIKHTIQIRLVRFFSNKGIP